MEYIYDSVAFANEEEGNLNQEDGIDCPVCKNKGYIVYLKGKYEKIKDCECMKARRTFKRLMETGITRDMLERLNFKTFKTNENWQRKALELLVNYCKIPNNKNWIYLSGISGSGKTHLCTATFQYLVKQGLQGEYLLWNEFIPRMISMERSVYTETQQEYMDTLERLQNVDVLYIDDFLKLASQENMNTQLSIAYRILNSRYMNNKITIISSEVSDGELKKLDLAIYGRIFEKADKGNYMLYCGKDTNRNFRLNGE